MTEWGKIFHGGSVKVGRVYWPGSSLVIFFRGPWHYAGDKVTEILKSMKVEWKASDYRLYYYGFERGSSKWIIYVDIIDMPGSAVEPKETVLKLYMQRVEPSSLHFSVLYHPKAVNLGSVNLEDLLKSLLYRLPHIAEDVSRFSWAGLMGRSYIIAYHDRELVTRIDVVFSCPKVPYKFVVAYHIDGAFLSVDLHVVTDVKSYFDLLAESVVDEYWQVLTDGGGEG